MFGAVAGAVALFGAGGYVQRRKDKGELGGDDGDGSRPQHTVVEDDGYDVVVPRRTTTRTKAPD